EEYLYSLLRKEKFIAAKQKPYYSMAVREVEGRKLLAPTFMERDEGRNIKFVVRAREADLRVDMKKHVLQIHMVHADGISPNGNRPNGEDFAGELDRRSDVEAGNPSARAMTWQEMLERRQELLRHKEVDEALLAEAKRQRSTTADSTLPEHIKNLK